MSEHEVDADGPEGLLLLIIGLSHRFGCLLQNLGSDIGNVITRVAVLRCGLALGRGDQRPGEPVDLGSVVVEVVLPDHPGALAAQQPAQCVADRRPAGAADVDGTGGVRGDEFEVDVLAREVVGVAVAGTRGHHVVDDDGLRRCFDAQVDEAGPGDVGGGDAWAGHQCFDQPSGQLAGVGADLLGDLKGQVGGVIAVLGVAGPLDGHGRRQRRGVEAMRGQDRGGGGLEQLCQVGGGHEGPSYVLGGHVPNPLRGAGAERPGNGHERRQRGGPRTRGDDAGCDRGVRHALGCPGPTAHGFYPLRPRSSGDRASASGAEGRRFESCRGHNSDQRKRAFTHRRTHPCPSAHLRTGAGRQDRLFDAER